MKQLLIILAAILVSYLLTSFVSFNWNITKWGMLGRGFFIFIIIGTSAILLTIYDILSKTNDE